MDGARPEGSGYGYDPRPLLDLTHCPVCRAPLPGPTCPRCGVDLSGADGARLRELSTRAADALAERDAFLRGLAAAAAARRASAAAAAAVRAAPRDASPVPSVPPLPAAPPLIPAAFPAAFPAAPTGPPRVPRQSLVSRIGVQGLLVALGALLLAVAGVVFLVFAWDRLSLGWRALVIASITGLAMAGAAWLRPRLPETAEAVGGLAVVLVLADAWAIRATGLLGADRVTGTAYAAAAAAGCAVVLLAWGWAGGVRAGSLAAAVVGPVAPVLVGVWLAPDDLGSGARAVATGLVGAALVAVLRRWTPMSWHAERAVLRGVAGLATGLALAVAVPVSGLPGRLAGVLALVAAGAVGQIWADSRWADHSEPVLRRSRRAWSAVSGAAAALAAAAAAVAVVRPLGLDPAARLALAPVAAAAMAWGVLLVAGRRPPVRHVDHRLAARAARVAALLTCLPATLVVTVQLALVVIAATARPWSSPFGGSVAHFVGAALAGPGAPAGGVGPVEHLAGVLGLGAAGALLAASKPHRWAPAAAGLVGLAVVGAPVAPGLALGGVVLTLTVVATGSGVVATRFGSGVVATRSGDRPLVARTALAVAASAGFVAVLTSWGIRETSVPMTLLGAAGLLLARRVVAPWVTPVLVAGAVVAVGIAGGAVVGLVARSPINERVAGAAVVAAVLAGLLAAVPLPGFPPSGSGRADRLGGVAAGAATGLVGAAVLQAPAAPGLLAAVLGALSLAAAVGAARTPRDDAPAGPRLPVVLAAALAPLVTGTAGVTADAVVRALAGAAGPSPGDAARAVALSSAAVLVPVGAALAVVGLRAPADLRRIPAEVGAAITAVVVLLGRAPVGVGLDWWWILLLLLGTAVTASALPADRHRVGWVGWVLLTASSWVRLRDADVGLVEAYTVPPALALLAVAALRLRRDRSAAAYRTVLPGLGLALLPSVAAAGHGSAWRPALLLGLAAVAVVGSARWTARPGPAVDVALGAGASWPRPPGWCGRSRPCCGRRPEVDHGRDPARHRLEPRRGVVPPRSARAGRRRRAGVAASGLAAHGAGAPETRGRCAGPDRRRRSDPVRRLGVGDLRREQPARLVDHRHRSAGRRRPARRRHGGRGSGPVPPAARAHPGRWASPPPGSPSSQQGRGCSPGSGPRSCGRRPSPSSCWPSVCSRCGGPPRCAPGPRWGPGSPCCWCRPCCSRSRGTTSGGSSAWSWARRSSSLPGRCGVGRPRRCSGRQCWPRTRSSNWGRGWRGPWPGNRDGSRSDWWVWCCWRSARSTNGNCAVCAPCGRGSACLVTGSIGPHAFSVERLGLGRGGCTGREGRG